MAGLNDWEDIPSKTAEKDDWQDITPKAKTPVVQGAIENIGRMIGGGPEYMIGSAPVVGPAINNWNDAGKAAIETLRNGGNWEDFQKNFGDYRQGTAERRQDYESEHPVAAGGLIMAANAPVPGSLGTMAAKQGAGLIQKAGVGAVNLASRLGATTGTVAADAAARGVDPLESATTAGGMQLALEGGIGLVKGAAKYTPRILAGVKPETMSKYQARAPQINAANEEDLVHDIIDAQQRTTAEPLAAAKMNLADAKTTANRAEMVEHQRLSQAAPPAELPSKLMEALKGARKTVSAASGAGFEALEKAGQEVSIVPWKATLTNKINSLKINGTVPPSSQSAVATLETWRNYLDELGKSTIRPESAKQVIQALDEASEQAWQTAAKGGGYVSKGDRALMDLRSDISNLLKESYPGYAEAMAIASTEERTIQAFHKMVGSDERTIANKLPNLDQFQNEAAEALMPGFGNDMSKFNQSKTLAGDKTALYDHLANLPENRAVTNQDANVESLKAWNAPVANLGDTASAQSTLRNVTSQRPNMKAKESLDYLGELSGQNFSQQADDLGVQRALSKGFVNGSRNVNLGSLSVSGILGGVSHLMGGGEAAAGFGKAIGAGIGAASDLVGPQMVKKWMDLSMQPGMAPFKQMMQKAAERGPQAIAITHYMLSQQHPEFRDQFNSTPGDK